MSLAEKIERLYHQQTTDYGQEFFDAFKELKQGLNSGEIRAAEPAPGELTGWKVNAWVKMGILLGFRVGMLEDMSASGDGGAFTSYGSAQESDGPSGFVGFPEKAVSNDRPPQVPRSQC